MRVIYNTKICLYIKKKLVESFKMILDSLDLKSICLIKRFKEVEENLEK